MFGLGPVKKTVIWNTISQLVGKFIGGATALLTSLLIAKSFGARGYGEFALSTTFVALFYLLADFGLNASFLQQTVGFAKKEVAQSWGQLLVSRSLFSLGSIFLALVILVFIPRGSDNGYTNVVRLGVIVFLPTIFFQGILTSSNAIFQKELRYDFSTLAIGFGSLVSLVLIWLITQTGLGLATPLLLSALTIGSLITALTALVLTQKLLDPLILIFKFENFKKLFESSLPIAATLIFNLIYFRIDHVILGLTRSTAEVGVYALAYKIFEFILVLPTFFMNAVFPLLLKTKEQDLKKYYQLIKRSGLFLLFSSLFLALITWLMAPWLVLIKSDFLQSVPALRILAISLPFFFLSALTMWGLIIQKKQWRLVWIYGVSMLVIVGLDSLFIPRFGYAAAAWITVIGEGTVLLMSGMSLAGQMRQMKPI